MNKSVLTFTILLLGLNVLVHGQAYNPDSIYHKDNGERIYHGNEVDILPEYQGGRSELLKWLTQNVEYPIEAKVNGIHGKVLGSFIVETDGRITDPIIIIGVDESLDLEAIRILGLLPDFKPGIKDGQHVRVEYVLPVNFSLGSFNSPGQARSPNNFFAGVEYLQNGNYVKADSCLTLHVLQFPEDKNGLYNLSVAKLMQGDTCSFCQGLYSLNYPYDQDKQALKAYFGICGDTDTIYYNKKNEIVPASDFKYFEVIEQHNCKDLTIGKYHLKKAKIEITSMDFNAINSFKTDIYGIYQIVNDSIRVFTHGTSLPTLPSNVGSLQDNLKQSPAYEKAKKELDLSGHRINTNIVVGKNGSVRSIEYISSVPSLGVTKQNELLKYLDQMFSTIPYFSPAEYNGERVNFKLLVPIYF